MEPGSSHHAPARPFRQAPGATRNLNHHQLQQQQQQQHRDDTSLSPSSPSPSIGSSSSEGPDLRSPASSTGGGGHGHGQGIGGHGATKGAMQQIDVPLLGGEKIEAAYPDITYLCPYSLPGAIKGTMTVTNYKLYFRSLYKDSPLILDVPLGFVSRVDKVGGQRSLGDNAYGLEIFCKDIRSLRFRLNKSDGQHPRKDIFEMLRQHSFPLSYDLPPFAFVFKDRYPVEGWNVYNPVSELKRLGLPNESWKISKINDQYQICDTYPRVLGVPKLASDEDIAEVAKFRSKGRFPVLSWMHPDSLATICRCSQPLVGVSSNRSRADETYVQILIDANAQSHRIFIMDARPKVNSMVNIVNGGGYESEDVYQNAELHFLDIHNIHVMRESLRKVKDTCFPLIDDAKWLSNVDGTHWLNHLHCILSGALKIADKVETSKTSVIVHCSDGWDRTAQLTSLAMIFLDPYYRTLMGFQVLIEKEWLGFGHKFAHRIGHGVDKHNDNDRSPVFLQFIDCVWQVTNQFPQSFEFNEYFLTFVLDHLYSCLFGTFLSNCERERKQQGVSSRTQSLWSFVNHNKEMFLNALYNDGDLEPTAGGGKVIFPETSVRYMRLWTGYYCRWNPRMRPQDTVKHRQSQVLAIKDQLRSKVETLRKELEGKRKSKDELTMGSSGGGGAAAGIVAGVGPPHPTMIKYDTVNI